MNSSTDNFSILDSRNQTTKDREFTERIDKYFDNSIGKNIDKLRNFTKYVPRQTLSLFLAKQALFQKVINIHGHIIECGVFLGGGLMTWAQLSAIKEAR